MNPQKKFIRSKDHGFSLVEVMIAMFVLTLLALATTRTMTYTKFTTEDTLYEATTLNLGLSIIEQMKGRSYHELMNPPLVGGKPSFTMRLGAGAQEILILDEANQLDVPIVTEAGGDQTKRLPVTVTPSMTPMTEGIGLWLEVHYSFPHPRSGKIRERFVYNAKTNVESLD
ncbi:MAG: prepilin-type N-terminal cleavage/methylation domain-containing protein [Puniceicoccaceae bacterium]|nr:MAG: prepilin-type N-terminal cleavage/methylation domain-containing protein [Puniceicoccaceae bacterium]